jgi:hypothetical protein
MKKLVLVATVVAAALTACAKDKKHSDRKITKAGEVQTEGKVSVESTSADLQNGTWLGACVANQDYNLTRSVDYVQNKSSERVEAVFVGEAVLFSKVKYAEAGCSGAVISTEKLPMMAYSLDTIENDIALSIYSAKDERADAHTTHFTKGDLLGRFSITIADEKLTLVAKNAGRGSANQLKEEIGSEFYRQAAKSYSELVK